MLDIMNSTALFTDHYEFSMLQASLHSKKAYRKCTFEVFARRLPKDRSYGVVAGTGRLLEALMNFTFGRQEIELLQKNKIVNTETLDYLSKYRFTGNIWGYQEGEIYFPGSPILIIESTFGEACILETLVLSIMNHDSAIASAASRMTYWANGRPCIEMGSRRTHEESAISCARASYISGFDFTSNLEAARRYGIKTNGTSAHSFILLHDTEEDAFRAQIESMGKDIAILVDTYDISSAVKKAINIAGTNLAKVRIDSGNLAYNAKLVREILDSLGATDTLIVATGDLDEFSIASLENVPIDLYGIGTSLVTGSGAPTASMVYKLVSYDDDNGQQIPVAKMSENKKTIGGRKYAFREINDNGKAVKEIISINKDNVNFHNKVRNLLVQFVNNGIIYDKFLGYKGIELARKHHINSRKEIALEKYKLKSKIPAIPTVFIT